jgi:hypothetical protein
MLFGGLLLLASGLAGVSAEITASDLPQCAIECYCEAGERVKIPITAYKEQCLSAPFQLAIRECGIKACSKEEFEFVHPIKCLANYRRNIKHRSIVKLMASTLSRFLLPTRLSSKVGILHGVS